MQKHLKPSIIQDYMLEKKCTTLGLSHIACRKDNFIGCMNMQYCTQSKFHGLKPDSVQILDLAIFIFYINCADGFQSVNCKY